MSIDSYRRSDEVEPWKPSLYTASPPVTSIPCSGWSLLGCPHLMQQALLAHSLLQCKIRCKDRCVETERWRGEKVEHKCGRWVEPGRGVRIRWPPSSAPTHQTMPVPRGHNGVELVEMKQKVMFVMLLLWTWTWKKMEGARTMLPRSVF